MPRLPVSCRAGAKGCRSGRRIFRRADRRGPHPVGGTSPPRGETCTRRRRARPEERTSARQPFVHLTATDGESARARGPPLQKDGPLPDLDRRTHRRRPATRRVLATAGVLAVMGAAVPLVAQATLTPKAHTRSTVPAGTATGDTRHVTEPALPTTVCATVPAARTMPTRATDQASETTPPDTIRIQHALDTCAQTGQQTVSGCRRRTPATTPSSPDRWPSTEAKSCCWTVVSPSTAHATPPITRSAASRAAAPSPPPAAAANH